ncbi:ArdC family protein [Tenacibaculum finnmarkense]|uniref:ArdC family protein n=1 Tax=Tenacibaculum finnmarkense TaxID=2781243 RepID=UPI00187B53F9|nr:zincin-like metallopeptidase domain-containing protein [Tenacibaculum finnmarkense]MBE7648330.1 DUF1738 domain-containing protein [Tenacibaculum finnmarkense genomovar ulcerans]
MTIQQQFKNLNGSTVSRSQLEAIIANAKKANDTEIIYRLSGILLANKGVNKFDVSLRQYPTALAGSRHKGAYKEALTECGRLRKGWKFSKGGVYKVSTLDKKTKQFKMGLSGCGCGAPKNTCGCKKKSLNENNLSFNELEGLGLPFIPNPESVEDPTALGKPFTNDDIYQMITDKMISLVEKSTGKGVQKKWGQKEFYEKDGFLIPINFVSKNAYRGVNPWLLKDDFFSVMDNPYFMTFKQIKEKKGTLKKGSKGTPIVYFTLLYKFDNPKTKKEFGTYDKEYMIKYIKNFGYSKSDFDDVVNSIAILKYYNVFNGSDIEDIDFKLDELQLGRVLKSDESLANEKNEIAELIVKNYPKPAPTIKHGGNDAYHQESADLVQMPRLQSFDTPNDYYAVLFHELIHSTGNKKRLSRKLGNKFGSKEYAKEELIAEFGAVFLSAQSGIIWHSNKNHAEYLKNWQSVLKIAKDDNKFLMRGASAAQKASDFVLNLDANNVPAFHKELGEIVTTKKSVKKTSTKKMVSIPDSSAYPVAIPETKKNIKANAPFDSCGRLRKGWKFQNGKPVQVIPKKKATKKAEIKKVVVKKIEKPTKTVKRPSKEVVLKDRINQEGNYIKQITAFLKETRAKSKKTAKDKKNINYWVIAIKEAKKRKSLNEKLLKELGEILTPKKNDVTIYAYNKITAKEMAVYSDDELYLLYRAIAKQQNKTGIDKELIRYNRGVIIKALRHPLKHYSYLDKTYNFVLDELIEEKKLHDHAILGHDAHMYSDKVIAKGYAYANLARFIYFYRLSFPFYKRTKLLKEAQNPELRKLFEKEIKKRKLKVNVQAVVPITPEQKAIKRKRDAKKKTKTVVKPAIKKNINKLNYEDPKTFENDLDKETLRSSYYWVSFDPDRRAKSEFKEWITGMAAQYLEFKELSEKESYSIDDLNNDFEYYHKRLLKAKLEIISSRSKTASSMITGSANFPVASNRKKMGYYQDKITNFLEIDKKGIKAIKNKIKPYVQIKSGEANTLEMLEQKVFNLVKLRDIEKDFNKNIHRKSANIDDRKLFFIENNPVPFYKKAFPNDSTWSVDSSVKEAINGNELIIKFHLSKLILDTKKRIKAEELRSNEIAPKDSEMFFDGGYYIHNIEANRIQVFYDEKPNNETKNLLKKNAFRWSPKNNAWQRQMTRAAISAAEKLFKTTTKTAEKLASPKPQKSGSNSLAYKMANRQNQVSEIYKIKDKNISEFLGQIEVKEKESVVITLTGGQGSMKTRCAFRFINAFAQKYKVGHASIEEHPESTLYYNKVDEYINDNALNNIHNPEINSISDLDKLVKENDIIVIDSFAKMQEIQKGFEVDKDLRKKYDGKLFIVIFQQTTDGKMRGGSKSQFDADIILFTEKFDNYQDNYIYADKNRYQNKNLTDLKYNIFEGVLKDVE